MRNTLTLLLLSLVISLQGQVITKLSNGSSTFYYDVTQLGDIVINSAAGDTIILPGGPINCFTVTVNKPLCFIGAGILSTGTPVTGKTVVTPSFNNDWVIQAAGSGSSFHGIDFDRPVRFTGGVSNISFTRCAFSAFPMAGFNMTAPNNVQIRQCLFRSGITNGGTNAPQDLLIENSIIVGGIDFGSNDIATALVTQCVLLDMITSAGENEGVTFTRNIFTRASSSYNVNSAASYQCNLFCMTTGNTLNWTGATDLGGNLGWQITPTNVFVNVPVFNTYNETYDYHLTPNSPGLSSTMGCAEGEVGIYGGPPGSPWKDGAIPFNPHWISLSPSLGSTNGGVINVNLSGAAQQN